jgi:hypothetical protein
MSAYIDRLRQIALEEGVDPNVALQVVRSEGGFSDPFIKSRAPGENSIGPLQLNLKRGVGQMALAAGIDPRTDWESAYRFGLRHAKKNGWLGDWMGARKIKLADRAGLSGAGSTDPITALRHIGGAGSAPANFGTTLNTVSSPADASSPTAETAAPGAEPGADSEQPKDPLELIASAFKPTEVVPDPIAPSGGLSGGDDVARMASAAQLFSQILNKRRNRRGISLNG